MGDLEREKVRDTEINMVIWNLIYIQLKVLDYRGSVYEALSGWGSEKVFLNIILK